MKKFELSNIKFTIFYSLYSVTILNIPAFKRFFETLAANSLGDYLFGIGVYIIIFLFNIIFFGILFQKYITKLIAVFFLVTSSIVTYFILAYNVPIDSSMVENAFATDVNEVRDLISIKMIFFVGFFGILPAIGIIFFLKIKHSILKNISLIVSAIFISLFLMFLLYFKIAGFFRVNRGMNNYLTPINYLGPIIKKQSRALLQKDSKKDVEMPDIEVKNSSENLNIVLIVGETARSKNFSLYGYERETNPNLAKQNNLKILKNAISCSTSTRFSLPCIFNITPEYESFLTSLQRVGIYIKWYENNYGGCYDACSKLENKFFTDHGKCDGSCPDGLIFEEFYKDIQSPKGGRRLFILHQNGSHGPLYYKRYPKEFAKFTPECKTSSVNQCSKEELVNAYDNTIFYTDFLINETIEKLKSLKTPSVLIYVSDHGESLGENGIFLHGFPYAIAPKEQKEIPFLLWSSNEVKVKDLKEYNHKQVIHTIFNLLDVNTSLYNEELNIIESK